ncbi:XdhC family protein [Niallia endozanthoxylica]|uniref:XdhC family protein n=1 Tax=Niallia endozanthoxylica TaxID=2036016 RepID=UPI001CC43039|nr:XdhC/CoxI family protein [Niallia endozanthoxylica]
MKEYLRVIAEATNTEEWSVLATIIHVEGSAYLKEGTTMLFLENGKTIGLISPGCLEEDLFFHVKEVFASGICRTVVYDLSAQNDFSWGQGMGCNGKLYILLEYVDEKMKQNLRKVYDYLQQGKKILHIKKLTPDFSVTASAYITETGHFFGHLYDDISDYVDWNLPTGTNLCHLLYSQIYSPQNKLIIFGAGPDARPLANYAAELGFLVTVCDWRESLCNLTYFPKAEQCILGFPGKIFQKITIHENDFVVLMTHQFKRDQEILSYLEEQNPGYLGILGSQHRTKKLFRQNKIPPWVSAPVGLPIGAVGPGEIAISIVAEIIGVMRQKQRGNRR